MRILIAEDDYASRTLLKKTLSKVGQCDIAENGLAVLDLIEKNQPYDLICLDIMMPKYDGISVLKMLRAFEKKKRRKSAPVIMVSALYDKESIEACEGYGIYHMMWKPIDIKILLELAKTIKNTK